MSLLLQERPGTRGPFRQALPEAAPPEGSARGGAILRYAVVAAIALYLVFCHGCHGDEDHELFCSPLAPRIVSPTRQRGQMETSEFVGPSMVYTHGD